MDEEKLRQALLFFEPPPDEREMPKILESLRGIVEAYRHNAHQKHLIPRPFEMAGETEEAYLARIEILRAKPRKRGRPARLAQLLLVFDLRCLLLKSGCHHGAPKPEDRRSRLAELAEFIHEAVGAPQKGVGWRRIAERMADPVFQIDLIGGNYPERPSDASEEFRRHLHENTVKPSKNKK